MTHEDFQSLELYDVLTRVLRFCKSTAGAEEVHWLSAFGLSRIEDLGTSAEMSGKHVLSQPAKPISELHALWKGLAPLFKVAFMQKLNPITLAAEPTRFAYPVYFGEQFLGVLMVQSPRMHHSVELYSALNPSLQIAAKYIHFAFEHLKAKNDSYIDEVTGLHNQRFLPMALEHEIQRSKREAGKFSLLFLDIDFFKQVNDGRGHWIGSKLLIELSKVLKKQVRASDYTFRYGGDEFIVVLAGADRGQAQIAAERIRRSIESHLFRVEGHDFKLTVSIGLATFPEHGHSSAQLIQLADEAMYNGKRKSRNIVFVAS